MINLELMDAIHEIPNEADEIANFLSSWGIRGTKGFAFGCPLAIYLKSRGADRVSVSQALIIVDTNKVMPTEGMKEFMLLFDSGAYKNLDVEYDLLAEEMGTWPELVTN